MCIARDRKTWAGGRSEARYVQRLGASGIINFGGRELRNDELMYIKVNDSTESPYGYGAVEMAYFTINRLLGVQQFAGDLASNTTPKAIINLKSADEARLNAFRDYWQNQIEGQGKTPIVGMPDDIDLVELFETNDSSLYLEYQTFLIRTIATAFGLSPMNLGIEADVNRNTAEVTEDKDWDNAILPCARSFAA